MKRHACTDRMALVCLTLVAGTATTVNAQDLRRLSIEQLMQIEVTSVSKREESLFDAAAAIFVITREDIRRSGATCVPEALRLAPGVEVAQLGASSWAVTIRGFNGRFASQLLVLIDGRSVYTPLFAGVFWDEQDLLLEDVDRIEVIRGPGGTLWGANAVNGVINIITRSAADTPGTWLEAGGGTRLRGAAGARHGGRAGQDGAWRVWTRWFDRDGGVDAFGTTQPDSWRAGRGGFRYDHGDDGSASDLMVQGSLYSQRFEQRTLVPTLAPPYESRPVSRLVAQGGNLLARWRHRFSPASELQVQTYYDKADRGIHRVDYRQNTIDLDVQHQWRPNATHDIVWGGGWRTAEMIGRNFVGLTAAQPAVTIHLFSVFAQDRCRLVADRLDLTLGTKVERNDYTGYEMQPSARLLWSVATNHRLWGAVSRAVRTPARGETDLGLDLHVLPPGEGGMPVVVQIRGSADLKAQELLAAEIGWRATLGDNFTLDAAAYHNSYDRLRTTEQGEPELVMEPAPYVVQPFVFGNSMNGTITGLELTGRWQPAPSWTLGGSWSYLDLKLSLDPGVDDFGNLLDAGRSPRHQARLFSQFDLPSGIELDACVRFVDRLPSDGVPGYVDGDLHVAGDLPGGGRLTVVGQSLLHERLQEFVRIDGDFIEGSQARRGVWATLAWRF